MRILVTACLAACALYAQPAALQPPVAGLVFDRSSQSLRRIQGIPGAALIGTGVDFGVPVTAAAVSPRMDSAIVLSADGVPHLFLLSGTTPVEVTVAGLSMPERIVFSPSGTAAALYSAGSVQVIRGLPGLATLAPTVRLQSGVKVRRAGPESLAVSDDGAYLLYAAGGPVELVGVAGDSRKLMDAPPGALAAFARGSHDAAVIHGGMLTLFRDVIGAATRRDLPGTTAPSAVAFSADGHTIFVASERARIVDAINVETGSDVALACDCAPTTLTPMGTLFRLNELDESPLWLLDAGTTPRLVFVPAKSDI